METLRLDEALATDPPEPQNFSRRVRMQNLAEAGGSPELEYFAVYFDAGAHTRPHTHSTDQVLCFVRGSGFVWIAGEERQPVETRGVVVIPAGVLHMHGAHGGGADLPPRRPRARPHRLEPAGTRRVAAVRTVIPAQ